MDARLEKNTLFVIFIIIFVDLVGFGILIPVIPLLLASPQSQYYILPHGSSTGEGYILLGLLTAVYPLMQFFSAPILGQLSDRYGRKKLLGISVFGTFLSYVFFAFGIVTRNLPILFLSRGLDGITGGNFSIAQASIADITPPEKRAKNFGMISAAFGLGFILGPFLGGKLSDPHLVSWFNASTPFIFAAILSAIELALIYFVLPETLESKNDNARFEALKSIKNIFNAFANKSIRTVLAVSFLFQAGFTFFTTFIAVYYIKKFGFTQGDIGNMFAYVGICIAFAQFFVLRRFPHNKEYEILSIGLLGTAIMLFVYAIPNSVWDLLLIVPVATFFNAICFSYIPAIVSRSADKTVQGQILGINASVVSLAQVFPPLIAGYLVAMTSPMISLIIAGFIVLIAAIIFWVLEKRSAVDKTTEGKGYSVN